MILLAPHEEQLLQGKVGGMAVGFREGLEVRVGFREGPEVGVVVGFKEGPVDGVLVGY